MWRRTLASALTRGTSQCVGYYIDSAFSLAEDSSSNMNKGIKKINAFINKHTANLAAADSLISGPPFLRLKRKSEELEKKNYVLQGNSGVLTPNVLARKLV
jgi:hypothetical protein